MTRLIPAAAAARSETTALLPASSPDGDSASTSAQVNASNSCWREMKCSRRATIFSFDKACGMELLADRFLSRSELLDPF